MGEEFAKREWTTVPEGIENGRRLAESPIERQHEYLAHTVTHWMLVAGVFPQVSWEKGRALFGLALGRPMVPQDLSGMGPACTDS